jgi:hypothetical protein
MHGFGQIVLDIIIIVGTVVSAVLWPGLGVETARRVISAFRQ